MRTVVAGRLLMPDGPVDGYVAVEDGRVASWGEGDPDEEPDAAGWIVPAPVNAHTHAADTFLRGRPDRPRDVAALVGPGGWKHRMLGEADPADVEAGIRDLADEMAAVGTSAFVDFREGGLEGVRLLRRLAGDLPVRPVVMGRPAANGFDDEEARLLLAEADGVGLSALADFPRYRDVEAWAEACHDAGKPFALHVSEARREDMEAALALEPAFLVHLCQATRADLRSVAEADVPVVVCPRSNAFFGLRPPLRAMVEAGVTVALGTDNGMLADGNVFTEMGWAAALCPGLRTEDLLAMASRNGRRVAGLDAALPPRPGEPADLIVLPDAHMRPAAGMKPVLGVDVPQGDGGT